MIHSIVEEGLRAGYFVHRVKLIDKIHEGDLVEFNLLEEKKNKFHKRKINLIHILQ